MLSDFNYCLIEISLGFEIIFIFSILAILTFEIMRSLQTDTEVIEGMNLIKELMELVRLRYVYHLNKRLNRLGFF